MHAACAALCVAGAALAALSVPGALRLGEQRLEAVSCSVRRTFWIEHYVTALYLPGRAGALEEMRDPAIAKALFVRILDDDHLPERIPREWREPIARHLNEAQLAQVRAAYAALLPGDELIVAYVPDRGVSLLVNDRVRAAAPGHDIIDAVLATWAGDEPLGEKLMRVIRSERCS